MLFKIESYRTEEAECMTLRVPTFIEEEDMQTAHTFACKVLGLQDRKSVVISPFIGRLPMNAVVLNIGMEFEEIYGEHGLTGLPPTG